MAENDGWIEVTADVEDVRKFPAVGANHLGVWLEAYDHEKEFGTEKKTVRRWKFKGREGEFIIEPQAHLQTVVAKAQKEKGLKFGCAMKMTLIRQQDIGKDNPMGVFKIAFKFPKGQEPAPAPAPKAAAQDDDIPF